MSDRIIPLDGLPFPDPILNDPAAYIIDPALATALKVAMALGQPLLVTGEAGSGKTQLAYWAALDFNAQQPQQFADRPLLFSAKTSASAKDLLYSYDAVRHFHDAGIHKLESGKESDYIHLNALGEAILRSLPSAERGAFAARMQDKPQAHSSVVLIDEIDKAPRDFPNDLLHELDRFEFSIAEMRSGNSFRRGSGQRIVTIITSNSEKNLPEPFLRRCAFHHIEAPDRNRLRAIVQRRLGSLAPDFGISDDEALFSFYTLLRAKLNKKPATAELLNWLQVLNLLGLLEPIHSAEQFKKLNVRDQEQLRRSLSVLVKSPEDMREAIKHLGL